MGPLKRKWARFVLVMLAVGVACLSVSALIRPDFPGGIYLHDSVRVIKILLRAFGWSGLATAAVYGSRLRCPHCGRGLSLPRWRPGRRRFCAVCGKPLVCDDEAF